MTRELREGFTTGSAASAAAKAAVVYLLTGETVTEMETPLPPGGSLVIPIDAVAAEHEGARARVIKDGGDDPDATHGKAVEAFVVLDPDGEAGAVELRGGHGVGTVTLPGLPVAVGEPAINPEPRKQIARAVREAMDAAGFTGAATVTVEVPEGKTVAQQTMNPRLGIVGGISILGTRGTVKPFSHESWAATIRQELDVAKVQGLTHAAMSTGGRTEGLLKRDLPDLPALAFVQFADFFAVALAEAAKREFEQITIGCYFGKLVKMAQGFEYTHARETRIDFSRLARWCESAGLPREKGRAAEKAVTARHVLEMILDEPAKDDIVRAIAARAHAAARRHAGAGPRIELRVYDFSGALLCATQGGNTP